MDSSSKGLNFGVARLNFFFWRGVRNHVCVCVCVCVVHVCVYHHSNHRGLFVILQNTRSVCKKKRVRPAFHVRVSAHRTARRKVTCVQLCRPVSIAGFPRANFGAPKSRSMHDFSARRKVWDVYTDIMRMRMTLLK